MTFQRTPTKPSNVTTEIVPRCQVLASNPNNSQTARNAAEVARRDERVPTKTQQLAQETKVKHDVLTKPLSSFWQNILRPSYSFVQILCFCQTHAVIHDVKMSAYSYQTTHKTANTQCNTQLQKLEKNIEPTKTNRNNIFHGCKFHFFKHIALHLKLFNQNICNNKPKHNTFTQLAV